MVQLTFHGAAETVTGSKYLLDVGGERVLFDCGLFQGLKELRSKNWDRLPFDAAGVRSVVLTHAHIDHIGYLPRFVRQGFRGPVYCTPATADLAEILLLDAAKNQEGDADYANRKGYSRHKPALPLFDERDVAQALKRLEPMARERWFQASPSIACRYHDAGHLLGASMIEVGASTAGQTLRILFSGDVGRYGAPLYHDPRPPTECDFLICESTYGDREHAPEDVSDLLTQVVHDAVGRGGLLLVPSFAVGRAQQLIYLLEVLMREGRIPELPVFLDSPMAIDATEIYRRHHADHDLSEMDLVGPRRAFWDRNLHLARSSAESRQLNQVEGPAVIIASSGMMIGGRILHHLKQRLPDARNTIVLAGFMAAGTRGRALQDGAKTIRVHGQDIPVRARVADLSGMSGHADRSELLRWLQPLPAPRRTFMTHGEKPSAESLAAELRNSRQWNVSVPRLGEAVELR